MKSSRLLTAVAVAALLIVLGVNLAFTAQANSATWDEPDHIYAAYLQWKHGDFGLNPEHPPLVKFLAALPLLDLPLNLPPMQARGYRMQAVNGGKDFLFQNDANTLLLRVRLAAALLTLLLALLVFLMAREMFTTTAGLIALALIAFDPTLLAHSALLTTDAGQACFMLWTVYAFYRYANRPTPWRLVTVALVLGLALATKHSSVLIFPMLLVLGLTELFTRGKSALPKISAPRLILAFAVITVLSITVLWSFYGFRYAARPAGVPLIPDMATQLAKVPSPLESHVLALFAQAHLFPASYIYGFAHVLFSSHVFNSYLLGTTYPHPVWFYFPIAMLIKSSLTFLILLAITLWTITTGKLRGRREILYLVIPAAIYMAFAMAGGMNIGVRHVLPVYIFLSILIAAAAAKLIQHNRRWLYAVAVLLLFQAISVLHAYPAYITYANEAFGGPAGDYLYLSDSSSDWGQQMKSVKTYINAHGIQNCWFAYFGQGVADFRYYGIPCKPLITADSFYFDSPKDVPPSIDGPVFMSAGVLSGFEYGPGPLNAYAQFQQLKPAAVIDYGVFVFNGHFDIPLASALSHVQKAQVLLSANNAPAALAEAQQAESLAPGSSLVNATLGRALDANHRPTEARPYFEKALTLARTVESEFQRSSLPALETRLSEPGPALAVLRQRPGAHPCPSFVREWGLPMPASRCLSFCHPRRGSTA